MSLRKVMNRVLELGRQKRDLKNYYTASPGSVEWLKGAELKYGGMVTEVTRNKVSPADPRSKEEICEGGMTGGDRMRDHGYAAKYTEYLAPYIGADTNLVVAEFGILKGSGLAMWSELFPEARILGFDIDLSYTQKNMEFLMSQGAFVKTTPELFDYDQFVESSEYLGSVLNGAKIDICIDDGFHSVESIMCTMKSLMHHFAENFVLFVEDNREVHGEIRKIYPELFVDNEGELTIIKRR